MKKLMGWLGSLIILLGTIWLPGKVAAQDTGWVVDNFKASITLNQDTTVKVKETIEVDFGGLQKHGIYRTIPVKYKTKYGNNLDIRFRLIGVTNKAGEVYQVERSFEGDNVKLKIGEADKTISGKQTYVIDYEIKRVITTPNDEAEFYWNVTGNRWPVPISVAEAEVKGPDKGLTRTICFKGFLGSTEQQCEQHNNGTLAIFRAGDLAAGDGLTIAVGLDQSKFAMPTAMDKLIWFLTDNILYATPLLTLLIMIKIYWKRGRDKRYKNIFSETEAETVPLFQKLDALSVYGPPKDLSPGEVGVLIDEVVHMRDITAVIIDLARKGFFKIKEVKKKGLLFSKTEFKLIWQDKEEKELTTFERSVLDMLFGKTREKTVKLNDLPKNAYQELEKAKDNLYKHLTETGYFAGNPKSVRITYIVIGAVLVFLGGILGVMLSLMLNMGGGVFGFVVSGLIILGFAAFMPARTAKGRKALKEVVGLKEWIRIGAWREQIHEKHNFLEEVLPYTIAFGLTYKFIEAFKNADLKKLSWYESSQPMNVMAFNNAMTNFGNSINSGIAATRPKSSASSGGSGFSGGGFSGGGFGGGGGGSW